MGPHMFSWNCGRVPDIDMFSWNCGRVAAIVGTPTIVTGGNAKEDSDGHGGIEVPEDPSGTATAPQPPAAPVMFCMPKNPPPNELLPKGVLTGVRLAGVQQLAGVPASEPWKKKDPPFIWPIEFIGLPICMPKALGKAGT